MRRPLPFLLITQLTLGLLLAATTACSPGGGSSTPTPSPVSAPQALTYATNPAVYTKGVAVSANAASHGGGTVTNYAVSPALPAGLVLDALTGNLTGTPSSVTPTAAYTVTATNASGSTTAALTLTVNDVPPAHLAYGTPVATYTVGTAITPNTATHDGGAVTGYSVSPALPAGLVFNTVTAAITGTPSSPAALATYTVTAINSGGSTMASLSIVVNDVPGIAPAFTTQPANVSITEGQNAQFVVAVGGTPAPTLQWQVSTNSGANWSDISGETGTTFTALSVALSNNGRQFRAVATNGSGSVNSHAAVLTVNAGLPLANIVFERGYGIQSSPSDLFLIKEDGSGEIPLADSADHETFLAVAPGGKIVYRRSSSSQTRFYSVNADGTGVALLVSSVSPTDLPVFDGITSSGWVIYRSDTASSGRDIYAVKADGTSPAPTPLATSTNNEDFITITTGGKVIYSVSRYNGNDLSAINADGTGNTPLAVEPNVYKGYKGQTSSGQLVIDTDNGYGFGSIYTMDEGGGSAVTLATNGVAYEYTFAGITSPGQVIVSRSVGGQPDLYGNGTVALANSADAEMYRGSTAGGQVIYQRIAGGLQADLYIVNADGSNTTLLTGATGDDHFSALTPDGRVIYTKVTVGQYDIYMVNADGTGTVPVAVSTDFEDYKGMTPDGHVIYERTGPAGTTYLYAFNPGDNVTTPLATSGGHTFFVGITPNNKVLFRRQSGNSDLYIVNADGTGMTPLANTGNNEFFAAMF